MKFTAIEQITAHRFIGNHYSDSDAFKAIETFALDMNNSVADRAESLRVMGDVGMDIGREEHLSDEELLQAYEESCS